MIIGHRFLYEHILHNIRHSIAMVRFADVGLKSLCSLPVASFDEPARDSEG
jgi:hypothetical protein